MTQDRGEAIREGQRREWGSRSRHDAARPGPRNRPFAELLVAAVRPAAGERVPEVATGSGVVAVEAARAVGPTESVLATDLAPEWGRPSPRRAPARG